MIFDCTNQHSGRNQDQWMDIQLIAPLTALLKRPAGAKRMIGGECCRCSIGEQFVISCNGAEAAWWRQLDEGEHHDTYMTPRRQLGYAVPAAS